LQSHLFAKELKASAKSDEEFVGALLNRFKSNGYRYTLKPGPQEDDEVDYLLFDSKKGFCAHYAGAFVFLLRSAGIPARMVAGYQGGKYNSSANFISVRQYDAHAWAEVWLPGKGWQRFDPTAFVAPERIEFGLERAVESEQTFLQEQIFSLHRSSAFPGFKKLNALMSEINYQWQEWVLSYDKNKQSENLLEMFGANFRVEALYWLAVGFAISVFVLGLLILWRPFSAVKLSPIEKSLMKLNKVLLPSGMQREDSEPIGVFFKRLSRDLQVLEGGGVIEELSLISKLLEKIYYLPQDKQSADYQNRLEKEAVRLLRKLTLKIKANRKNIRHLQH